MSEEAGVYIAAHI